MDGKDKIPAEPVTAAVPRLGTQLRLQALEPKRRRRFTALDEVRAFVFLIMLLLMFILSALSRSDDPIAAFLQLFGRFFS